MQNAADWSTEFEDRVFQRHAARVAEGYPNLAKAKTREELRVMHRRSLVSNLQTMLEQAERL